MQRTKGQSLSSQRKAHVSKKKKGPAKKKKLDGDTSVMLSTGSTLVDLAITGGRIRGGGIPTGGIVVEIFGPNSSGKTVFLCEMAGEVQRKGGIPKFNDPENRLNKEFAKLFDFYLKTEDYSNPDTVTQVFEGIKNWDTDPKVINALFTDSLAALSTDMEMEKEDKMGMRRAKELSEGLRKTCRIMPKKNINLFVSNQVRINQDGGQYSPKYKTPGGEAVGFYASIRLFFQNPQKIYNKIKYKGKEIKRAIGVKTDVYVFKNSTWKPYRSAPLYIIFDYGIDDVRANLQFIKDYTSNTIYTVNGISLDKSLEKSIRMVEDQDLEDELKEQVIDLWELIESKFSSERKKKKR